MVGISIAHSLWIIKHLKRHVNESTLVAKPEKLANLILVMIVNDLTGGRHQLSARSL
jgi:hypothetical protein